MRVLRFLLLSHPVTRILLVVLAALFMPCQVLAYTRPTTYSQFNQAIDLDDPAYDTELERGTALKAMIEGNAVDYIYLRSAVYLVPNPITINRTTSLYLHGQDEMFVQLVSQTPSQPLFVVTAAPLVNFARMSLIPTQDAPTTVNSKAIVTQNTVAMVFESIAVTIGASSMEFQGPGTYNIQMIKWGPNGVVYSPLIVDHPQADVLVRSGDSSNGFTVSDEAVTEYAHIWQKRGRVRAYSLTVEATTGVSDFHVETPSALGPHVFAGIRSEGRSPYQAVAGLASRLLHVPTTAAKVDVVLKANAMGWSAGANHETKNCSLASYNGAGTLWMIGNKAESWCGLNLVEGTATGATIVSVGNLAGSPTLFPVTGATVITASDLYNALTWDGSGVPYVRWVPSGTPTAPLKSRGDVPFLPRDSLPPALTNPRMDTKLPGMISAADFGATGDGQTDDTAALQDALDEDCTIAKSLYIPAGTYRITDTLYVAHHAGGGCRTARPYGGWIVGAGRDNTRIVMDAGVKKGVFATDGMAWATVAGMTFKTWPWQTADPEIANTDVEAYTGPHLTQAAAVSSWGATCDSGDNGGVPFYFRVTDAHSSSDCVLDDSSEIADPKGATCYCNASGSAHEFVPQGYIASQNVGFYDMVFDGGFAGLAAGMDGEQTIGQCDKIIAFGSTLKNAHIGLNSGHQNAILNGAYDSQFLDNDYSMGTYVTRGYAGGPYMAYSSISRGARLGDFQDIGAGSSLTTYFNGWYSDGPHYLTSEPTSGSKPIFFENSYLHPQAGQTYLYDSNSGMGPIYLYSQATRSAIRLKGNNMSHRYAIKLQSEIPDWDDTLKTSPSGQIDSYNWRTLSPWMR